MEDRRRCRRIQVSWGVVLTSNEDRIVGRAADVSPFGICVVTAPTAAVQLGKSYHVEAVADVGVSMRFIGNVRHIGEDRIGLESHELLPVR